MDIFDEPLYIPSYLGGSFLSATITSILAAVSIRLIKRLGFDESFNDFHLVGVFFASWQFRCMIMESNIMLSWFSDESFLAANILTGWAQGWMFPIGEDLIS